MSSLVLDLSGLHGHPVQCRDGDVVLIVFNEIFKHLLCFFLRGVGHGFALAFNEVLAEAVLADLAAETVDNTCSLQLSVDEVSIDDDVLGGIK